MQQPQNHLHSGNNGVSCDRNYQNGAFANLKNISIVDQGINDSEKKRHLNDLDQMPYEFLQVYREKGISIKLRNGGVTGFAEMAAFKGVTPDGWAGTGYTWDSIPGAGYPTTTLLGDSKLPNNAWSLAIHEGTHSVDQSMNLGSRMSEFSRLKQKYQGRPLAQDQNFSYRHSNMLEYIAVAVDEYFCSASTRNRLRSNYPELFDFMDKRFISQLNQMLNNKNPGTSTSTGSTGTTGGTIATGTDGIAPYKSCSLVVDSNWDGSSDPTVNLRSEASTKSTKVGTVQSGQSFNVQAIERNGEDFSYSGKQSSMWLKIDSGWIWGGFAKVTCKK